LLIALYIRILENLREEVRHLEVNEEFERTMMKRSDVMREVLPSTDDLDGIMQSLMISSTGKGKEKSATPGRAPASAVGHQFTFEAPVNPPRLKGKGRSKR